ncbi:MAG: flagellar basal body L-ring protein FlgH [Armatimonadota bacterium]
MTRRVLPLLTIAALLCAAANTVLAQRSGSLWRDERGSLFTDLRAMKAGDTVTVLVMESSIASQKASTDLKRDSNFKVGPGGGFLFKNIGEMSYGGSSTSKGEGSTSRSSNLITRLTATVTDVLPNGNLVIQGEREIRTNEENQIIRLSGVIRPSDVSPDNTVSSTLIADAKIELTGKGPIAQRQREGILTQLIRLLF